MAKKKMLYPMPEAIDGAKWDVRDSRSALTDTKERKMFVPATDSPEAEFLRSHETAHARITPKKHVGAVARKHGVSVEAIQVCEDLRVHSFLEQRNIRRHGALGDAAPALVKMIGDDPRKLGGLLLSSAKTNDYDTIVRAIEKHVDETIGQGVIECVNYVQTSFERTWSELNDTPAYYRTSRSPISSPRGFTDLTVPVSRLFDSLFPVSGEFSPEDAGLMATYSSYCSKTDGEWGRLTGVSRARMTMGRRPKGGGGKSWRDEGALPSAAYRLILDGRIFARRKRMKGGTVLIDASGSMSFSATDLERIIAAAPGAVVAAYAGCGDEGKIMIVAERGRMANKHELARLYLGGGNIIDGPALRWLAKQPGPRVWVSDGYVTGVGDRCAINLAQEARVVCQQASIKRVDKADAVVEALK